MDGGSGAHTKDLTWENVGLAFSFIVFDAIISRILGLGVGSSLTTSAVRCVIQLTLVALVLQKVFEANNPWVVAGIACEFHALDARLFHLTGLPGLLNLMGTSETGELCHWIFLHFKILFPLGRKIHEPAPVHIGMSGQSS